MRLRQWMDCSARYVAKANGPPKVSRSWWREVGSRRRAVVEAGRGETNTKERERRGFGHRSKTRAGNKAEYARRGLYPALSEAPLLPARVAARFAPAFAIQPPASSSPTPQRVPSTPNRYIRSTWFTPFDSPMRGSLGRRIVNPCYAYHWTDVHSRIGRFGRFGPRSGATPIAPRVGRK